MPILRVTSTALSVRRSATHETHPARAWRDPLEAVAVALVGIGILFFVLIVLPWVISI
jgi:hypothetical protein